MAKKKRTPTVEIHLTVDGCIIARQPPGVRVVVKDFETDIGSIGDPDSVTVGKDRHGNSFIKSDFPA